MELWRSRRSKLLQDKFIEYQKDYEFEMAFFFWFLRFFVILFFLFLCVDCLCFCVSFSTPTS